MVTRKSTIKATIVDTPFVETVIAPEPKEATSEGFSAYLHKMLDDALSGDQPSWKRQVVAYLTAIIVSFGAGYMGGTLLAYLMVGSLVLSGSLFLMYAIYFLGILLVMYAGGKLGSFTYLKIVDKSIDRAAAKARDAVVGSFTNVRGWFAPKPVAA